MTKIMSSHELINLSMVSIVKIDLINVDSSLKVSEKQILEMKDSISNNGLINPIIIDKDYNLVSGLSRLESSKLLGKNEIECKIVDGTKEELELIKIDENLVRKNLSSLEEMNLRFRKKELLISMNVKGITKKISEENNISMRLVQIDNKAIESINDNNPQLLNMMLDLETSSNDNFKKEEIKSISESESIQNKLKNNMFNSISHIREEIMKEKNLSFEINDMNEIVSFYQSKALEIKRVVEDLDEERLFNLLKQIDTYTKSKIVI